MDRRATRNLVVLGTIGAIAMIATAIQAGKHPMFHGHPTSPQAGAATTPGCSACERTIAVKLDASVGWIIEAYDKPLSELSESDVEGLASVVRRKIAYGGSDWDRFCEVQSKVVAISIVGRRAVAGQAPPSALMDAVRGAAACDEERVAMAARSALARIEGRPAPDGERLPRPGRRG